MRTRIGYFSRIMAALILLLALSAGCNLDQVIGQSAGSVLKSTDGVSQIAIPAGWKPQTKLNEIAVLQAAVPAQEMYVIVITEPKADFAEMTLDKYSELTRQSLINSLTSPQITPAKKLTINGRQAVQHRIQGTISNLNVIYLHTAIETQKNYHYVLAWTLKSRFEKNEATLQQVTASFKEIQ